MTRKKQQKSKKQNPGVFISNFLGGARSTQAGDRRPTDPCSAPVSARRANEGKNCLASAESVVLCKTVLELALVNIALSGQQPPGHPGPRDTGHKNIMAPVSSSTSSGQSGLSKLMSPVQDLGKSLLGFLIGSPPPNTAQPPASSEPSLSSRRTSGVPPAWETSAGVPPTSPGRQRPPGHPALGPSVGSTPVVIRRNKVVRSETLSLASDTASVKASTVTEEPEEATAPVKAMPRNQSQNSRRKKNRRGEAQDDKQKPSDATLSTSPPKETVTKPSRSQSRNSRRRKAKRAAVMAAAVSSPPCHQDNEDAGDHETGSEKTESVSFDSVSGVQLSQGPIVTNEIVNTRSHETSYQGGPTDSHDLEDCGDSSKEWTNTPSEIVMKRKSYKQLRAQNIEDEQTAGFVTARNSVIAECHESESPLSPEVEHCDISVAEANSGQSNCHAGEKSSEEVKEIKRKEVLDIQDDPDKATREVTEQPGSVKISDAS